VSIRLLLRRMEPLLALSVAVGVALALLLIFRWGGAGAVRAVDSLTLLALSTYATVCAVLAARSAHGGGRRAWAMMAVALAAWTVGDLMWSFSATTQGHNPFPSFADGCYVAFSLLAGLAMAMFPTRPLRGSRLRIVLDGVTVMLCLFLLMWTVALHGTYDSYAVLDRAIPVVQLLFPIGDLVVLTTALHAVVRAESRHRSELWLLATAVGFMTLTHLDYAHLVANGRFRTGSLLDLGWAVALIVFAAAAQLSRRSPSQPRPAASVSSNSSLWLPYLPLLLAGTVGPAIIMSGVESVVVPLVVVAVCFRQSVTAWENRRLLSAAADQALRDPLTGLANRTLFYDRLTHVMMLRQREDRSVAVVSIDLDDFKLVNDSLGHPAADTILVSVGERIIACVRAGDTVARLGGDEFALLLEGRADHSYLVAGRVVEAFDQPFVIDGEKMLVRPSVGIAVASSDEPDLAAEALMKRADMAMYAAKRSRSSGLHSFSPDMALAGPDAMELAGRATDRPAGDGAAQIRLLGELRRAIDHAELDLVYQPKLHLRSGRVVGVEALLRWPHPELGVLRPDEFMPLVRRHGLMRQVTELVVARALDDVVRWETSGVGTAVAVNVFAPDLKDAALPDALCEALRCRGLAPSLLTIEITEDLILNDIDRVTAVLHRLREQGIRVAIDDFGSGFSALSYLRDLPIDEVKLDRQFISSITEDKRAAAVVRAVIDLTHELDVTVVAEGIEDAGTADWLREHGCDIGQGYYFGEPVAASMIPQLIGA
jgi:diguanylate cyclase (GGDEF)-like protein